MLRWWLAVAVVVGCGKSRELAYHRIELPGFSLEVPTFVTAPRDAAYRNGDLQHKQMPTAITIAWQPGESLTTDELPVIAGTILGEIVKDAKVTTSPARRITVANQPATQMDATVDKVHATFVDITCGKRSVLLGIVGLADQAAMRDRMLASFACKPVEAEETRLATSFGIGADDPAIFEGWRFTDEDRSLLTITNDELVVAFVASARPRGVELEQLRSLIPKMFGAGGATFTPLASDARETRTLPGGERRVFERGTLTADGETVDAVTSVWACADPSRAVIALGMVLEDVVTAKVVDFIAKVRCAEPGDPPLPIAPYQPPADPPPE